MLARRLNEPARVASSRWRGQTLAATLALLFLVQFAALLRAPAAWTPESIALRLAPGESSTLAPLSRAAILRDANGNWLLAPAPDMPASPLLLRPGAAPESMASMPLPANFLTLPGGNRVQRLPAEAGIAAFEFADSSWRYNGATLLRNGEPQAACPDARWTVRLASLWNRIVPGSLTLARPLSLGGNLHCGNRIGIAGVMPDAASITRQQGELRITDLERAPRSLDGVRTIALGALRLDLGEGGATRSSAEITLIPHRRVPQFAAPDTALPPQTQWQWRERALWPGLPHGVLEWALMFALTAGLAALAVSRVGAAVAILLAGLCALTLQRIGQPPAAALSLLLSALALASWLGARPDRTPATASAAILIATGLLLQLELGLGGSDLRYFQKTCALLATGLGALTLWQLAPSAIRKRLAPQRTVERILLALAALALAALAAQVVWGDETGVFDMQPVELAKLALCTLAAHCLALRFSWHDGPQRRSSLSRWLALAAPVILFFALLASALVQVDDYSPLILLSVWAGGTALAYASAAGKRLAAALLLAAGAAAAFGIGALHQAGPSALPDSFYADRFQVWLAPGEHPHTGQQLLRGASAIAQGGLAGADSAFGLRSAGLPAGEAVAIPAVQDDFAPSFFLNRHGLLAGLALWSLQAALLASLVWQAWQRQQRACAARAYQQAWAARFHYFALCGGAALLGGHLLLSWGTNLAILPVMGQPMSFLSAGGSHLLFFLLPLLGLSAASNEE